MDRHEIHWQLKLKGKLAFDSSFASISKRRLQGIEFRNSPNAIRVKAEHLDDLWLNRARFDPPFHGGGAKNGQIETTCERGGSV